jgi:site-specific recombinase XerD
MKADLERYESYLEHKHPNRSTKKHYASDLNIFVQYVGEKTPKEVRVQDVDAFIEKQSQQQLKGATINRRLVAISGFFDFLIVEAEEDGWVNPVKLKRHRIREGHHLPRDVNEDTVAALWAKIDDPRDQAMFALMLRAGLRVGEVVALNKDAVEGPGKDRMARLCVRGKGDKERIIWLTPQTWLYLHYWLLIRPSSESQALFLNQHARRLSVSGVQYRLKGYCRKAGVWVTCHQLRHTFARRLAEQNMPVDSLAKLLGHNDLQTTQRYIEGANLTVREDFLATMERLDEVMGQSEVEESKDSAPTFAPAPAEKQPKPQAIMEKIVHHSADLPDWLRPRLEDHTQRRIAGRPAHQAELRTRQEHSVLSRICRWLVQEGNWQQLDGLKRVDLLAYVHHREQAGKQPRTIQRELTMFRGFWRSLLELELVSNGAVLMVKVQSRKEHLPRYLKGDEFQRLEETLLTETSENHYQHRFDRAWFYLLAHGGLRRGEVLNLRTGDCDFNHDRLCIRSGKGDRDRVIPMTSQLKQVLLDYLMVRGSSSTDHLLLYKDKEVPAHIVYKRVKAYGRLAGIPEVTPHRLRHTLATLLINEGMPIVSLQKFLGHQDINDTLVYAKVHNETVRRQFAAAMKQIEVIAKPVQKSAILEGVDTKSVPLADI